ncbi:MAG: FHA domain-containing protein [Candidatus Hydrogenedentota bacterium]|nr:MAG: FHA domain-containing protein [Candidatus Hydrogenedentota bacterium]
MARLTLVFGRDVLGTYDIDREKMIIGRADDCDIPIDNLAVSRHHAIIEKKEGIFTINDLDSNNGTFVNGQRIHEPTILNFGDEIGVGKHVLVFDSHSKKTKPVQVSPPGSAVPEMDLAERGTMFVEPEKMEKIQKKATVARKAHLQIKGAGTAGLIPLEKTDIVFGKARDCDVKIRGFFASRRHAILSRLEKGFQLTNLATFSPTQVNGTRIESALLCDGDEISMGKSSFVFHSEQ